MFVRFEQFLCTCSGLFSSLIRSPHGKVPNMKVGVRNSIYKFRLETFLFRTTELEDTEHRKCQYEVVKMQDSTSISCQAMDAFHRTVFVRMFGVVFSLIRSPRENTEHESWSLPYHLQVPFRN